VRLQTKNVEISQNEIKTCVDHPSPHGPMIRRKKGKKMYSKEMQCTNSVITVMPRQYEDNKEQKGYTGKGYRRLGGKTRRDKKKKKVPLKKRFMPSGHHSESADTAPYVA
jgi:hypothetical protein